jgi:L-ascorbate metabolism protein UlaG (beta-lactamase superfamily)
MDSITFVGTATTLLRIGSFTLLTDPNFLHRGQRAYLGKGLWSRRLTEPAMSPEDLPRLDAVVLSHLHGDHFDRVARRKLDRGPVVLTTPHAARRLSRWGFSARPLETWQCERLHAATGVGAAEESLTVESLPAVHAYGVLGRLLPPVMGTLLEHRVGDRVRLRMLVSGDTLTGDHVDAIAERHPEIDVAVVHLGGTRVLTRTVTMDADQGVDYVDRLGPRTVVPVHYDDYRVFRSPVAAFLARAKAVGLSADLRVPARGQTLPLTAADEAV